MNEKKKLRLNFPVIYGMMLVIVQVVGGSEMAIIWGFFMFLHALHTIADSIRNK